MYLAREALRQPFHELQHDVADKTIAYEHLASSGEDVAAFHLGIDGPNERATAADNQRQTKDIVKGGAVNH